MGETSTFLSLTLVATLVAFGCIVSNRSIRSSKTMAQIFYIASAFMSVVALLWVLFDTVGILPQSHASTILLQILIYRGWIVIGTGISSVLLVLMDMGTSTRLWNMDETRSFLRSPYVLRGLCLSVSMSFICTEIGKLAHDADMRQFFLQSGYPVYFLYFTMAAETLGSIALFFPRALLAAAVALAFIMVGAISTHLHNRDPFSDSLEALHLLVLLACIIVIRNRPLWRLRMK